MKEILPTIFGSIIAIITITLMIVGLCIVGTNYYDFRASTRASIACFEERWKEDQKKISILEWDIGSLKQSNARHERQYLETASKYNELVKRLASTLPAGAYIEEPKPSAFDKEEFKEKNGLQ
jgi:septal ring factor EnvC (AmiA/AmiB activator)